MTVFVCGVDEAGRGPVIGPMVFSAVVLDEEGEKELAKLGVTDSKLVAIDRRKELFKEIEKISIEHKILSLSAKEISEWMKTASLNDIEAIKTAELLNSLESVPSCCYVDSPDVNPERYSLNISNLCKRPFKIVAEHKADLTYLSSGAASILAKVTRDLEVEELSKIYGEIGCGYPSDPLTQKWLDEQWQKNKSFPDCVRKTWSTVTRKAQLRLSDWH